jgi:hypothetical protein
MEIVRAINTEDLVYLVDLGVLESNCTLDLNFALNKAGLTPLMLACAKNKYFHLSFYNFI